MGNLIRKLVPFFQHDVEREIFVVDKPLGKPMIFVLNRFKFICFIEETASPPISDKHQPLKTRLIDDSDERLQAENDVEL